MKEKKSRKKMIVIIVVALIVVVIGIFAAIPVKMLNDMVNMHMDVEVYSAGQYGLTPKELTLTTEDNLNIAAWEVEQEDPRAMIILLSGMQNPSVTAFWGYAKMFKENGYSSLLIEMRGHGDSEGDRVSLGMEEILDVKAGVTYIKSLDKYQKIPIIVFGTSMGGVTAINSIGEIPEISGVISCSACSTWQDLFADQMIIMGVPPVLAKLEKPFISAYLGFNYGFDKLRINPLNEIQKLDGRPALIMHSTEDSQVPYASFKRLIANAGDVDTFVRGGDEHFICYEEYIEEPQKDKEFSEAILNFLKDFAK